MGGELPDSGSPVGAGAYGAPPAARKKSPLVWLIPVLLVVIGGPVVCCGGCALIGIGAASAIKAPFDAAVTAAKNDARVQDKIGTPIETVPTGNSDVEFSIATIRAELVGPKGMATINGEMQKSGDEWSPKALTITFDDDSTITIP